MMMTVDAGICLGACEKKMKVLGCYSGGIPMMVSSSSSWRKTKAVEEMSNLSSESFSFLCCTFPYIFPKYLRGNRVTIRIFLSVHIFFFAVQNGVLFSFTQCDQVYFFQVSLRLDEWWQDMACATYWTSKLGTWMLASRFSIVLHFQNPRPLSQII